MAKLVRRIGNRSLPDSALAIEAEVRRIAFDLGMNADAPFATVLQQLESAAVLPQSTAAAISRIIVAATRATAVDVEAREKKFVNDVAPQLLNALRLTDLRSGSAVTRR